MVVARCNYPIGMMMGLLDAMDEVEGGFGGTCVGVQIGGLVRSDQH